MVNITEASDGHSNSYFQFQLNDVMLLMLECPFSASLNNKTTIYNQSQEPNLTGNILLALNSKRRLMVLVLSVLLSNKKSLECHTCQKWK